MEFDVINPLREPNWNQWISVHKGATYFHTAEWAKVLEETYRYPIYYGVLQSSGRVMGLLPVMEISSLLTGRRGVSLPFSDECVPLLEEGIPLAKLIDPLLAIGRRRRWDYLEIRGGEGQTLSGAVPSDVFMVHELALESTEELQFKKLKDSHRRNIKKAQKEGVEIHRLQSLEAVKAYYGLHCLTRQRHGLPPQSWRFFQKIFEHIIAVDQGFVMLARHDGRWIAGAVYFFVGSKALYKFGASDLTYQHLRPNNLLMWEAIRTSRQLGMTSFSFGRTEQQNTGLLQFKGGWGAEERVHSYYRIGMRKSVHLKMKELDDGVGFASKVMKKMPIMLLRLLGALLYKHMG